jgi:hypothetical protein
MTAEKVLNTSITIDINGNVHLEGSVLNKVPFYKLIQLDKYILNPLVS